MCLDGFALVPAGVPLPVIPHPVPASKQGWLILEGWHRNQQPSCICCLLQFPPYLYHPVFQAFVFEGCCGRLSRAFDVKSRCPTPPALPSATGPVSWSQIGESCWSGVICLFGISILAGLSYLSVLPALGNDAQDLLHSLSGQRARQLAASRGYSALFWSIWMKS